MGKSSVNLIFLCSVLSHLAMGGVVVINDESESEELDSEMGTPTATNLHGRPLGSLSASLAIGNRGQILLQDFTLIEKLGTFVRERIPERVVHARGAGAHGVFEVTNDISKYTKALFLTDMDTRTPVTVRFSTVGGSKGSPDTAIDPHGFGIKFYTDEGNFDMVGNNIEPFPIRDPIMFPDLIHSRKPHPKTNLADPNAFWDFVAHRTETTLHTVQLFSDLGRPDGFRAMDGSSVHAFKFVNAEGEICFAKFVLKSNQKKPALTHDQAAMLAATDPTYKARDLIDAIEAGDFPSWEVFIKVMTEEQAENSPVNPFDITKVWSEKDFPLIPVGTLTLDFNALNHFTDIEQAAFAPSNMVPGIEPSPDRMLAGRLFAYQDAQRYRLGVNFPLIEVNRPIVDVYPYIRDGKACYGSNGAGMPNYWPNSFGGPEPDHSAKDKIFTVGGSVDRVDHKDTNDFADAQAFLAEEVDSEHRVRLVAAIADQLKAADEDIRERVLTNIFTPVGEDFADEIRQAIETAEAESARKRECLLFL